MDREKLSVRSREGRGSSDARASRAQHLIPGVIYSSSSQPQAILVGARDLRQAVVGGGTHALLDVLIDGDGAPRTAVIKELQLDPVRDRVIHVDLHEVRMDQTIVSAVPIALVGDAVGVRDGGSLSAPVHQVNIEALPGDIPGEITADISDLPLGGTLRLADITAPAGVRFTDDPEATVLATIVAPISDADVEG